MGLDRLPLHSPACDFLHKILPVRNNTKRLSFPRASLVAGGARSCHRASNARHSWVPARRPNAQGANAAAAASSYPSPGGRAPPARCTGPVYYSFYITHNFCLQNRQFRSLEENFPFHHSPGNAKGGAVRRGSRETGGRTDCGTARSRAGRGRVPAPSARPATRPSAAGAQLPERRALQAADSPGPLAPWHRRGCRSCGTAPPPSAC